MRLVLCLRCEVYPLELGLSLPETTQKAIGVCFPMVYILAGLKG